MLERWSTAWVKVYPILLIFSTLIHPINSCIMRTELVHRFLNQCPPMLNRNLATVGPFRLMLIEIIMHPLVITTWSLIHTCMLCHHVIWASKGQRFLKRCCQLLSVIGSLLIFRNAEHTTKSSSLVNEDPLLATFLFFAALFDFNDVESWLHWLLSMDNPWLGCPFICGGHDTTSGRSQPYWTSDEKNC